MDGRLTIEDGTLYDFIDVVARNFDNVAGQPLLALIDRVGRGLKQHNLIGRARPQCRAPL